MFRAEKQNQNTKSKSVFSIGYLIGFMMIIFIQSCSQKTTNVSLPYNPPESFSIIGAQQMPDKWWMVFENEELNALVDSALKNNLRLETVWQRLVAAQAVVKRESGRLYPDLGASFQGGVEYPQPNYVGGEIFRFGLSSDYEVDLWGRIGSAVEAERYRADASFTDYQTAALSLSAEIVRTWFQLIELTNQLALLDEQIKTNESMLSLIRARFGSGRVRSTDILRQQQLLEATNEQRTLIETDIEILKHRLNFLVGKPPNENIYLPEATLPEIPALPEPGIPAELIQRRPDIQNALYLLYAADRDLASAISNKYPRLSINASSSVRANDVNDLFQDWAYSLAGNIFAPLFQGGRLNAEVDRNEAVKKQRLYQYAETILIAFREVEDAMIREQKQINTIRSIENQLSLLVKTNEQLKLEYLNGMNSYLDVLISLDDEQQLRRDLINAKLTLLEYRIALYRALAGNFETEREISL